MSYEKQIWIDGESPLNAERFNYMEEGIFAAGEHSSIVDKYELIDTITVEEDSTVIISSEPDGTLYKFKAVLVFAQTEGTVGHGNLYIHCNNGVNDAAIGLGYIGAKQTDTIGYSMWGCRQHNGRWLTEYKSIWGTTTSSLYIDRQNYSKWQMYSIQEYPYITKLRQSGTSFPAGTKIEIWGIRA